MRVNTADLKNNLSKYLRHVRETGETITVCERNHPIARLERIADRSSSDTKAQMERRALLEKARRLGISVRLPTADRPMRDVAVEPEVAPDGRTDVPTIEWLRTDRDY